MPPFSGRYRFILRGHNEELSTFWLSTDHTAAKRQRVAWRKAYTHWYKFNWLSDYQTLDEGRGYYVEFRHAVHANGWDESCGMQMLKLCIMPLSGANVSWPADVGAANYHWEDGATARRAGESMSATMDAPLFDLSCAPGWMEGKGENGPNPSNISKILEHSPDWSGSHAIEPLPLSFFRTSYTPTPLELQWAAYPQNQVTQEAHGVGNYGGTCTCPNGDVYQVGNFDNCQRLACYGGVPGEYCGSDNLLGEKVMVICATNNVRETQVDGVGSWGGTCTCPDGQVFNVGDVPSNGGCNAWHNNVTSAAACIGGIMGPTCGWPNRGGAGVRVTCGALSPPALPPHPPPPSPEPPSMPAGTALWAAVQASGVAAITDGAIVTSDEIEGAEVFWGFQGSSGGARPAFGAGCARTNGTLVGTPCAPGVGPTHRYNLMLVRAGAHEHAGRLGLSQRRWSFERMADVSEFYNASGLLTQPGHWPDALAPAGTGGNPTRFPGHDATKCVSVHPNGTIVLAGVQKEHGVYPLRNYSLDSDCMAPQHEWNCLDGYAVNKHNWHRDAEGGLEWEFSCTREPYWFHGYHSRPQLSETAISEAYPIHQNRYLMALPPSPLLSLQWSDRWNGDQKWLQVSTGFFLPPVSGDYLFSVWTRGGDNGKAYLTLSASADAKGAYFVGYGNSWSDQRLSRWLPLQAGKLYYMELWADYLTPDGRTFTSGSVSAAVRLATTDASRRPIDIPADVRALGQLESGTPGCMDSSRDTNECYTAGTAGSGLMSGQGGWRFMDVTHAERGLDWMFRENYVFDPIPSLFLRHSGRTAEPEVYSPGGRGALRRWWGWSEGESRNPLTGALYLDEAWTFPWASEPGVSAPSLLNVSLPPNGTEIITEVSTGRTPFKGVYATYAETITALFRPKRTGRYAFKLWSDDSYHARLFLNPTGPQPEGAIEVAASRSTRFADRTQPWDYYNDRCRACAARARSDFFELEQGSLYFMRVYHAASNAHRTDVSALHLSLVMAPTMHSNGTWQPPNTPAAYNKLTPCQAAAMDPRPRRRDDSKRLEGEHAIDIVDDSWLVAPHEEPQVVVQVDDVVARCAPGATASCAVPPASAGHARRTLSEELSDMDRPAMLPPAKRATVDVEEEDDDHMRNHKEAEELPDLDSILARTPFVREAVPLGRLRRQHASADLLGKGGSHRRLSTLSAPLRWSSDATWGGQPFQPNETSILYIPNGTHLLLDVSVYVRIWVIEGSLTLADEADVELEAEAIIIHHGELHIGSAATPFANRATITLHGHWASQQIPTFGIKMIGLTQGKIFMHGLPKTPFVPLASSAFTGSALLTLQTAPTGWLPGDSLVVVSDKADVNCTMLRNDACETEEVVLLQIDGATITLSAPLAYSHEVLNMVADGRMIALAPEVINLNRNVRIRGADGPGTSGFGGHVMLLQPTDGESMIHHVELVRMGQAFRVGRYPLHLHAVTEEAGVGDVSHCSLVGVSVHHSFNRGINIHGGTGATVRNSTIYKNLVRHIDYISICYPCTTPIRPS